MILKFRVYEQTISLQSTKSEPRQGSKDYLELQFSFSSDWNGLSKYVYLQHGEVSVPHDLVEESIIVDEYFTEQTEFNVTLLGKSADGSVEVPTNVVTIFLKESNNLWVKDAPEPQNSWLVQVVDARDEALAAAIRAENAAIHQPYPNAETGTWWVWDADSGAYKDTGVSVGSSIMVDSELSDTSENPVQNKVIKSALDKLGVQSDWNQNDDTQPDYVKNRTHYEESTYVDYVLNMRPTEITGFSIAEVGEATTVKINGVESAETVKEAESSTMGGSYKYIGNIDFDSLLTGGTGWFVGEIQGRVIGLANPDTTIAVEIIVVHKINDKFINFDGFVRTFDYHFKDYTIYKTLYKDDGRECSLYMCNNFILPERGSQLFGFMGETGFSSVGSVTAQSCFVYGYIISGVDGSIEIRQVIFGTNTTEMEQLAARNGYTLTTKPNV